MDLTGIWACSKPAKIHVTAVSQDRSLPQMTVALMEHTVLRSTLKVFVIPKAKRLGESAVKYMTHHNDDLKLKMELEKTPLK